MGTPALVIRVIRTTIPTLEELNLPPVIRDIALSQRGLTLVTGTTGSGKSTTLAAMIDLINSTLRCKIMSIEDPVEFFHSNKKSLISQLELGRDTPSFDHALRQALRQDPDVILVGELRNVDTLRIALRRRHRPPGPVHRAQRHGSANRRTHHRHVPAERAQVIARASLPAPSRRLSHSGCWKRATASAAPVWRFCAAAP